MLKPYVLMFVIIFIGLIWKLFSLNRIDYESVAAAFLISIIISLLKSFGVINVFPHLIN